MAGLFQVCRNDCALLIVDTFFLAYNFPPNAEHIKVLRVVIRETFSRDLCDMLWRDLMWTLEELDRKTPESIHHGRQLLLEKNMQKHKAFSHVKV